MARLYESRKRILVTGGAGFLGSHLIDRLIGQGHEVICVDSLFTGNDYYSKMFLFQLLKISCLKHLLTH